MKIQGWLSRADSLAEENVSGTAQRKHIDSLDCWVAYVVLILGTLLRFAMSQHGCYEKSLLFNLNAFLIECKFPSIDIAGFIKCKQRAWNGKLPSFHNSSRIAFFRWSKFAEFRISISATIHFQCVGNICFVLKRFIADLIIQSTSVPWYAKSIVFQVTMKFSNTKYMNSFSRNYK